MKAYKIRDKDTGLYSLGGSNPKWTNKGKSWGNLGSLTNHLNMFCQSWSTKIKDLPESWEIVELRISEEDITTWPARIVSDSLKRKAKIKEKYGFIMETGLNELKDVDLELYRYCFQIGKDYSYGGAFEEMLETIRVIGIKRESYRYRTPIIVFNNIDDAFTVKLAFGEKIHHFIDLVKLDDLLNSKNAT